MYVFRHDLHNANFTGDFNATVSVANGPEGYWPNSLILARDGYFYGATTEGGSTAGDSNAGGTIFRLNYAPKPVIPVSQSNTAVRPITTPKPMRPAAHKRRSKSKKSS